MTDRIDAVRADPADAVRAAQGALAPWAGRLDDAEAPLRLALDMPTGLAPVGGLPKDLGDIVVPALPTLVHDADFLAAVAANPFHGGVLDDLGSTTHERSHGWRPAARRRPADPGAGHADHGDRTGLRPPAGQARGVRARSGAGADPAADAVRCVVGQRLPPGGHRHRDRAARRAHALHRTGRRARARGRAAVPGRAVRAVRRTDLPGDQGGGRADPARRRTSSPASGWSGGTPCRSPAPSTSTPTARPVAGRTRAGPGRWSR